MSIDEVMVAASRLATTTAVFTTPSGELDSDGESAVQERATQLRAAIEQHVAEAVAVEREACAALVEEGACSCCWGEEAQVLAEEVATAIRSRADHDEVTR